MPCVAWERARQGEDTALSSPTLPQAQAQAQAHLSRGPAIVDQRSGRGNGDDRCTAWER